MDGIVFPSKREAARYLELKLLERAGEITGLEVHPVYKLPIKSIGKPHKVTFVGSYIADFAYKEDGKEIVEDCKGVKTTTYRLKKRLVEALYGIEVRET